MRMSANDDLDREAVAEALDSAMRAKGLDQVALARLISPTQQAISDWLGAKKTPGKKSRDELAKVLGIDWEEVAERSRTRHATQALMRTNDYIDVNVHDAKVSAGTGLAEFEKNISYTFKLNRFILEKVLHIPTPSGKIGVAWVTGDCMLPDLHDGDPVFFDYIPFISGTGGRYVLWLNGEPIVKRVQRYSDGSLELRCENRCFGDKDELLIPNEDGTPILQRTGRPVDIQVVGPVIWPRQSVHEAVVREVKMILQEGYAELARQKP